MHESPNSIKKIFVCEFITAGGFNHVDLPTSLVHEGALMRDALLRDLSQLPYRISTSIDARLAKPNYCDECVEIHTDDDVWQHWALQMQQADAVWLIAPETDGLLEKLTQLALKNGKLILGCEPATVAVFGQKLTTYLVLTQANIATVITYTAENWPKTDGHWVLKPNDGAGCAETLYIEKAQTIKERMTKNSKLNRHVIQPYIEGISASISCVMHQGRAQLLSCNKQFVFLENNVFHYAGSQINAMQQYWDRFALLAQKIAEIDKNLNGYIGIDVMVQPDDLIVVVDINPRLTTSYIGLAQATGQNPAALIINTLTQAHFKWPVLQRNKVSIHV